MEKSFDSQMPINNSGINTIDKDKLKSYSNKILINTQKNCQETNQLIQSVKALKQTVDQCPELKISLQTGLKNIPQGSVLYGMIPNSFFQALNKICIQPPKFEDNQIVGLPFFSLFIDLINTRQGQSFFLSQKVNGHLKDILNQYNSMLNSQVSLKYMNQEQPNGWFCKSAFKYINYDEYNVDQSKPHWGFKSWNDWFTRSIRPQTRPIDSQTNSIVHSSDSYPYYYNPEKKRKNPCGNLKKDDVFWLKDNCYSLYDTLGARKMGITQFVDDHFVGGTIYQAFLGPWCYHRWHSPISGTIENIFIRNSDITVLEQVDSKGNYFVFRLKNKVNTVNLAFDKKNTMDDWINMVNKYRDQDQDTLSTLSDTSIVDKNSPQSNQKAAQTKPIINPNMLNFIVGMKMQAITIKTYLNDETYNPSFIEISLTKLNLKLNLHQMKTVVKLSLLSIDLNDNIIKYKMQSLNKLLGTERSSEKQKLIDIKVSLV